MAFTHDNKRVIAAVIFIIAGFAVSRLLSPDPLLAVIYTASLCSGMIPLAWLERRRPEAFDPLVDIGSVVAISVALPTCLSLTGLEPIVLAFYAVAITSVLFSLSSAKRLFTFNKVAVADRG